MKLLLILPIALLVACASPPKDTTVPLIERQIWIDPKLLQPCQPLQTLPQSNLDNNSIGENIILQNLEENVQVYRDCVDKQRKSILVIQKLANPRIKPDEKSSK